METLSECPNLIALSRQSWLRGHFSSLFPDITFHLTSDILKCLGIFVCRLILHVSVYSLISLPSLCFHCVLVCSGCCKKNTIDWVTCTSDNSFYFSRCWWLGSPRSGDWPLQSWWEPSSCLAGNHLLAVTCLFLFFVKLVFLFMYYHCYITAAPLNQSVAFQCHPDQKSQDS